MNTLHKSFDITTRAADGDKRELDVIASTGEIDAYNERIDPRGWDLARYLANPVVLLQHDSYGFPIGSASNVRVDGDALRATLRLVDSKAHPKGDQVYELAKQGALRSVSVGFRSLATATEKIGGRDVVVHTRAELIEISLVAIPANPNALIHEVRSMPTQLQSARTTEPTWRGKRYDELSFAEKHTLANEDPKLWDRMRGIVPKPKPDPNAVPKWKGKEYFELSFEERHELANTDEDLFHAMRSHVPIFNGKGLDDLTPDEEVALYKQDNARWKRMQEMR